MRGYSSLKNGLQKPLLKKIKIGLGTAGLEKGASDEKYVHFLKSAMNLGIACIDTAEAYGNGSAERLVGEAIKNSERNNLIITTKVSKEHLKYEDVINSARNSLRRLRTEYIDVYLIHQPNPEIPLKETMRAMDVLVEKKMVKYIGVSNFSLELLREAQSYTKNKIAVNQVEYNLLKRSPEEGLLDYCQKNDIIVMAYRPLLKGKLMKKWFSPFTRLSKKYNKTAAQLSLNWLISKKNVIAIQRTSNISHLKENLGAKGWELSDEDYKMLDRYFKRLWYIYNVARYAKTFIPKKFRF